MEFLVTVIVIALIAWLNHYLAEQRGRSTIGWVIGGLVFGLFATALLLILGETKEHKLQMYAEAQNKHGTVAKKDEV